MGFVILYKAHFFLMKKPYLCAHVLPEGRVPSHRKL